VGSVLLLSSVLIFVYYTVWVIVLVRLFVGTCASRFVLNAFLKKLVF